MEMTPISPRDVNVSLGDGAQAHGRDTSLSSSKEEVKPVQEVEQREYPVDTMTEALAARLRMADPHLDSKVATQIAKTLLGKGEVYPEKEKDQSAPPHERVDVSG